MTRIYISMSVCNAGATFCSQEVPKAATSKPAPEFFYCRNSAKHAKTLIELDSSEKVACSDMVSHLKVYWDVSKQEADSPVMKRFFKACCDPAITPPKGQKYILKQKSIKRKIVKASTTVTVDFTDEKNKGARDKFEKVFIKKANAKSGKFDYTKVAEVNNRRHLAAGSVVSATLEFDDDEAAQVGQQAVSAPTFATQVSEDLKQESVDITLTTTSAAIEEVEETVVEEVLVDDSGSGNNSGSGNDSGSVSNEEKKTTKQPPLLGDAPSKQMVSFAIALAAVALMR